MSRVRFRGWLRALTTVWLSAFLLMHTAPAAAQFKSWVLAKLPDTPEGWAADSKGDLYATLVHLGEVIRIREDGTYEHVAWVPSHEESGKGEVFGLDFDKNDNIYIAYTARSKRNFESDLTNPFHPACRDATVT